MAEVMFGVHSSENTDTSPVPSSQLADKEGEDWYPRKIQPWPRSLVITLCILGLWRPRRDATRKRRASSQEWPLCPQEAAHFQAGRSRTNSTTELIGYPSSATNNNYGATETLHRVSSCSTTTDETDDELGLDHMHCNICRDEFGNELSHESSAAKTKFYLVRLLMLLYLVGMSGLMLYDFVIYCKFGWGKRASTLLLVSYFTYLFQVFVVPIFGLLSELMTFLQTGSNSSGIWAALQTNYILERIQYLRGNCVLSCVTCGLFLIWPTGNGVLRIIYDYVYRPNGDAHANISLWCALVSYIMYGSFCFLIYIERKSFQSEFRVVAHFVASKAPKGMLSIDLCRDHLSAVYRRFHAMRDFVGIWMAFTMAVATWGITAHLTWNYVIFTYCDVSHDSDNVGLPLLNVLIWSQKIMFFVLPSLAVGGLNIDYVWREFRYMMVRHQRHCYSVFWSHIMTHMGDINLFAKGLRATLLFSALGLFLGLELSNESQNVAFWNGPGEYNLTVFCAHQ
ncbi:uncharacterized protein [Asterias amurensis]|uniref:uncharacterized protein n=1 Tax=Asterias amurensis TaxID=7602 RepID=UPI003AB2617A